MNHEGEKPKTCSTCCYELVERLGGGSMGEVWKAKHGLLDRPAAVKFIRPESLGVGKDAVTRGLVRRFEREARATAALTSPHTVQLYDFGTNDDGDFYYVMELLDGLDLRTLVEQHGPVPSERAIHFLRQACHSLAEAHAIGLTHRDVKPANIFTCRRGLDYDFVKILDFGLVKDATESRKGDVEHTMPDIVAGTPAFMAPELIHGDRVVDGRADIYALGCVAYWLVTGLLVFEAGSPVRIMLRHVNDDPAPPSSRTELQIPLAFEREILTCLAKDPARRPQSAEEFALRLSECEASIGNWTQERAAGWWRMHLPRRARVATPLPS